MLLKRNAKEISEVYPDPLRDTATVSDEMLLKEN